MATNVMWANQINNYYYSYTVAIIKKKIYDRKHSNKNCIIEPLFFFMHFAHTRHIHLQYNMKYTRTYTLVYGFIFFLFWPFKQTKVCTLELYHTTQYKNISDLVSHAYRALVVHHTFVRRNRKRRGLMDSWSNFYGEGGNIILCRYTVL